LNNIQIPHGGIRFSTIDVTYTIYSTPNLGGLDVIKAFSFFLFVNILGALLGYWISKKYRIQLLSRKWWTAIRIFCAGLLFMPYNLVVAWFYLFRFLSYAWYTCLFGFGIILLEIILLSLLIDAYKPSPKKKLLYYIKKGDWMLRGE